MLLSLKALERYTVSAADGDIGIVVNFLLDDEQWVARYLVLETRGFFDRRQSLISPTSFLGIDKESRRFDVALTKAKIANGPTVDASKPISRHHERDYYRYHDYAPYWGCSGLWGVGTHPRTLSSEHWHETQDGHSNQSGDIHLRCARKIRGCHIQGSDNAIGHIEDFLIDDETWAMRYLVIDTSNWGFGKKVLIAPHWAYRVSWLSRKVFVDLSRQAIKDSPAWDASLAINRDYESRLHNHYSRPHYWDTVNRLVEPSPLNQSPSQAE